MNIPKIKFDFFRAKRKKIVEEAAEDFTNAVMEEKKKKTMEVIEMVSSALPCLVIIPAVVSVVKGINVSSVGKVASSVSKNQRSSSNNFTLYIDKVIINNN